MSKNKVNPPKISIYFAEDRDIPLFQKLEDLRVKRNLSKNRLVLEIIREYFDNLESESSRDEGGADLREEVLDFFRSDEGRELVKEFVEKMKDK